MLIRLFVVERIHHIDEVSPHLLGEGLHPLPEAVHLPRLQDVIGHLQGWLFFNNHVIWLFAFFFFYPGWLLIWLIVSRTSPRRIRGSPVRRRSPLPPRRRYVKFLAFILTVAHRNSSVSCAFHIYFYYKVNRCIDMLCITHPLTDPLTTGWYLSSSNTDRGYF